MHSLFIGNGDRKRSLRSKENVSPLMQKQKSSIHPKQPLLALLG
jgi:hypothetical protein